MAITDSGLNTAMPGGARARSGIRRASRKPFLNRILAAVRRSMSVQSARHRRPGPADPGAFAASLTAGLTRGTSMLVDRRRG